MTNSTQEDKAAAKSVPEWSINMANGSSQTLSPKICLIYRPFLFLKGLIMNIWLFMKKAWKVGKDDPRKLVHCIKVGIALSFVSLFYYMRPLYDGVGGTAMWAVMTVVVAFEYTVGATLSKCLNRVTGTFLAAFFAIGVHWIAAQSGQKVEPIIRDISVFLLATFGSFCRFIPAIKARFDYGAMVFILTFTLVSVASYRVDEDKLLVMARERFVTIVIGTSFCILINTLLYPIWAGLQLHLLITSNINNIANSLDACVAEYFSEDSKSSDSTKKMMAYRCVLNSKATEEAMANFARWEPGYGCFKFQHPWKQYLKLGASMRNCAYCIEALYSCVNNKTQASESMKNRMSGICKKLSWSCSEILRELGENMKGMKRCSSKKMDMLVEEMNSAVKDLHDFISSLSCLESNISDIESENESILLVIPVATFASLLSKTAGMVEDIVDVAQELALMAEFTPNEPKKPIHK